VPCRVVPDDTVIDALLQTRLSGAVPLALAKHLCLERFEEGLNSSGCGKGSP
jgi:hypothetical protein